MRIWIVCLTWLVTQCFFVSTVPPNIIADGRPYKIQDKTNIVELEQQEEKSQTNLSDEEQKLATQLVKHLEKIKVRSPKKHVVDLFRNKDLIFLGEAHHVRENCEFVKSLIKPLDDAGVKRLCSEFTPSRFNDQLKKIVVGNTFDENGAKDLFRKGPWPTWGEKEYLDIVREAWRVNQQLKKNEPPFLIVGIDSDWSQLKYMTASRQNRFKMLVEREQHMEKIIDQTVNAGKQKVLVHIGYAHTVRQGIRCAKKLSEKYGDRMAQIVLHHEIRTQKGVSSITKILESVHTRLGNKPLAFNVQSSPLGKFRTPELRLVKTVGEYAENYVILKKHDQLSSTTWIKGFINKSNFADAKALAEKLGWTTGKIIKTPEQLDKLLFERRKKKSRQ